MEKKNPKSFEYEAPKASLIDTIKAWLKRNAGRGTLRNRTKETKDRNEKLM